VSEEQEGPWWESEGEAPAKESDGGEDLFSKLDADGDGVLTKEEFEQGMTEGPTLTGEVGTIMMDDGSVMGPAGEEGPAGGLSDSTWFVIGLIGAPIALGLLSLTLTVISASLDEDGWFYDEDYSLSVEGTVQLSGEDYSVFQADFDGVPDDVGWYYVEVQWNDDYARDYAACWVDGDRDSTNVFSDDGQKWTFMFCDGESDGDAYMHLDGSTGSFATKRPDLPDSAWIDGEEAGAASGQGAAAALGFLGAAVWPIGLVAGMVWGFTKGSSSFAYGMLASIVVVPLVLFGLCVIMIVVMFSSGGNF
jgi:hypothetical protein